MRFLFHGLLWRKPNADNRLVFKQAVWDTTCSRNVLNVQNEHILWSLSVRFYLLHAFQVNLMKDLKDWPEKTPLFFSAFSKVSWLRSALDKKKQGVLGLILSNRTALFSFLDFLKAQPFSPSPSLSLFFLTQNICQT